MSAFFDGLCGAVIGVIAVIAIDILKASVEGSERKSESTDIQKKFERVAHAASAAVLYILTLAVLYKFNHKYTAVLLVICGAVAGQFLFVH